MRDEQLQEELLSSDRRCDDHDLLTTLNERVVTLCMKVDEIRHTIPKVHKHEERINALEGNQTWINRIIMVTIVGYILKGVVEYLL